MKTKIWSSSQMITFVIGDKIPIIIQPDDNIYFIIQPDENTYVIIQPDDNINVILQPDNSNDNMKTLMLTEAGWMHWC